MSDIKKSADNKDLDNSTLAGAINRIYVIDVNNEITNLTTKESALTVRLSSKNFIAKDNLVIDADSGETVIVCRTPIEASFFANHDPNSNANKLRSDLDMIKKFQNAFSSDDLVTAEQYFEGIFYTVRTRLGSEISQQFRESFQQILREQTSAYLYLLFKQTVDEEDEDYDNEGRDLSNNEFLKQVQDREDYTEVLRGVSKIIRQASVDPIGETVHDAIGKAAKNYINIAEEGKQITKEEVNFLESQLKVFSNTCLMPRSIST